MKEAKDIFRREPKRLSMPTRLELAEAIGVSRHTVGKNWRELGNVLLKSKDERIQRAVQFSISPVNAIIAYIFLCTVATGIFFNDTIQKKSFDLLMEDKILILY